jgi:hypothetical protein
MVALSCRRNVLRVHLQTHYHMFSFQKANSFSQLSDYHPVHGHSAQRACLGAGSAYELSRPFRMEVEQDGTINRSSEQHQVAD